MTLQIDYQGDKPMYEILHGFITAITVGATAGVIVMTAVAIKENKIDED
jgi:hypothetical protein